MYAYTKIQSFFIDTDALQGLPSQVRAQYLGGLKKYCEGPPKYFYLSVGHDCNGSISMIQNG
jgi:hypothetical protein